MHPFLRVELSSAADCPVKVQAGGDFCLQTRASVQLGADGPDGLLAPEIVTACRNSSVCSVNLECPLVPGHGPITKSGPNLLGQPECAAVLKATGFNVAVLANNHILDHGPEALLATRRLCEERGLRTVGAGRNSAEASRPLFLELEGVRLAILAFAEQEFSAASATAPGSAKLDLPEASRLIRDARQAADLVIVNVHGGNEFYFAPSPRMQSWYRFLVESGAHAVIGHHTHVVQGMEVYQGAPILYSLGNFLFEYPGRLLPTGWYVGVMASLQANRGGVCAVELRGVRQVVTNGRIRLELLAGDEACRLEERFQRLSQIAADPELVSQFWRCFVLERGRGHLTRLKAAAAVTRGSLKSLVKLGVKHAGPHYLAVALAHILGRGATRQGLRRQEIAGLLNLFRCAAHHEVTTSVLEMELNGGKPKAADWDEYHELMKDCR
jgi:poly-gamma-glutamate synthesis protein (capsule biosynthesis protein)